MSTQLTANSGDFPDDPNEQGLLPELNGVDLVMSLSPKTNQQLHHLQTLQQNSLNHINAAHSTPFSVTDILSPIEEYRKLELNPPSPYRYDLQACNSSIVDRMLTLRPNCRSNSSGSSVNSPSALGGGSSSNMANPYAMGPLYHSPGVQSYCTPTDNLSLAGHYTDMRNSASWYGSTANDPRFASEWRRFFIYLFLLAFPWHLLPADRYDFESSIEVSINLWFSSFDCCCLHGRNFVCLHIRDMEKSFGKFQYSNTNKQMRRKNVCELGKFSIEFSFSVYLFVELFILWIEIYLCAEKTFSQLQSGTFPFF